MGRYKSLLLAEIDARRFEHAVDILVPGTGLGKQLDVMTLWCKRNCRRDDWAEHGHRRSDFTHYARFYFIYPNIADAFAETFDGERVDKLNRKWSL